MVVLPTPPLGEKTMNTWPSRSPSATPVGPWMASQVLRGPGDGGAECSVVVGRHDGADAGLHGLGVDLRARARDGCSTIEVPGWPERTRSASHRGGRARAWARSRAAYSPRPLSQPSTSSARATTWAPPGSAEVSTPAVVESGSTRMGMGVLPGGARGSVEEVGLVGALRRRDLGVVVEQAEGQLAVACWRRGPSRRRPGRRRASAASWAAARCSGRRSGRWSWSVATVVVPAPITWTLGSSSRGV